MLDDEALYGLPGEIVNTAAPHTEADTPALLANILVGFGNAAGRNAYVKVGADRHGLNLFVVLVGVTSKGRKGTSWGIPRDLLHAVEPSWVDDRVTGGLSSGEGLIHAVRDRVVLEDDDGALTVIDEGTPDKRLLAVESEFAGPLKIMTREGNTLSMLVRQAWDGGKLATLTRNSPLKATDAHISIIAHTTRDEVLKRLSETDTLGGFTNRFLWLMVRRSKALPFGGGWSQVNVAPLTRRLSEALEFAERIGEISWGSGDELWVEVYDDLSEGRSGLFGAATSRAEAQTLRLAATYAVMDLSTTIERPHLEAALALWRYAEASARYIFGDATGDQVADRITSALEAASDGLTRTDLSNLFKRHKSGDRIDQALGLLERTGQARREKRKTGGRPSERWFSK
jgi:hypothetical protein